MSFAQLYLRCRYRTLFIALILASLFLGCIADQCFSAGGAGRDIELSVPEDVIIFEVKDFDPSSWSLEFWTKDQSLFLNPTLFSLVTPSNLRFVAVNMSMFYNH